MTVDHDPYGSSALDWLFGLQRFGMAPGLERMRALLVACELPDPGCRFALVGGTNGKGSVARVLSACLAAAGHRTGSFYSPHLTEVGERASVDGVPATDREMEDAVTAVRAPAERLGCTFFEVVTAAALHRFRKAGVTDAVMEVGMGGRLDATNVLEPAVSVVTNVSLDHQAVLGRDEVAIAREKAGVMRPGVPAITGATGAALEVLVEHARAHYVPLTVVGRDVTAEVESASWDGVVVAVRGSVPFAVPGTLRSPMVGRHQAVNLVVAALAAGALGVPMSAITAGAAAARWPGRIERLDLDRSWVLDGAHNAAGAQALRSAMLELGDYPAVLVFGASEDKDLPLLLEVLGGNAGTVVLTRAASSPRSASLEALRRAAARLPAGVAVRDAPDVGAALTLARQLSQTRDAVLVAGSLFIVGEARRSLMGEAAEGRQRWQ